MKWSGQHIYDLISRFRDSVYLEDLTTTTETNVLVVDSAGLVSKSTSVAGDLTSIVAGTGLSGTSLTGPIPTLNVDASLTHVTGVGTIGTGTWQGTAIASAYLDSDTAHLSGAQTFTGVKKFSVQTIFDGDKTLTPGDGGAIHVDTHNITDSNTSASGTAALYTHVNIEGPRLLATNLSVTTTDAATLYIKDAPAAATNQTIDNAYALWVDDGLVKFDGALTVGGTITGDVTGNVTGNTSGSAATVTAGTQAAITTCANLETVGTIGTGVWQGTTIKTAYIGDDQVTEDKLADTLLAEIDANTAKATNVTTNLTATTHASQITINSSDGTNVVVAEASGSIAGVMTVAHHDKLDSIEAAATADQSKSDIDGLAITTVGTVDTGVWNGTKITDIYTNSSGKRYGSTIKILPSDFMINEDAASPLSFKDGGNSGVHVNDTDSEAIAFITIPEGMKATLVDIYGTHAKTIKVWEVDLNASFNFAASTIGTGAMNTQLDITDTDATATNYLAIQVTLTATTQRVWGGIVTIAPQ